MSKLNLSKFILFISILASSVCASSAEAAYMNHKATKGLVRLSLWYEGMDSFQNSIFKPGAADRIVEDLAQTAESAKVLTEELEVALDNIES